MSEFRAEAESRTLSDEDLVAAIRAGDGDAWSELVRRYGGLVMSIPRGMGLSREDAEEVFQATWRTLFQHLASIRDPGRVAYWIRTTARRETWRLGKERSPDALTDGEAESLLSSEEVSDDPVDELGRREAREEVVAALERLEPRCRVLLSRLFLDQPTPAYDELAAELGLPVGSIGPTRIRCLEKLARILGAEDTDS